MIEHTTLIGTDLRISRIAFGCEQLGGTDWGHVDEKNVIRAVRAALDLGINCFDTADVYGLGRSECMLAEALGEQRQNVVIATKFGINWRESEFRQTRAATFRDASAKRVTEAVEASLRRLRLDCIPLYQIHWPDPATPVEVTVEALERCRQAGKIRYIGCCNFSGVELQQVCAAGALSTLQIPYSLVQRGVEIGTLSICRESRVNVLAYGCLGYGLLSGKYSVDAVFGAEDRRSRLPLFRRDRLALNTNLLVGLAQVAQERGRSQAQVAIRWVLDTREVAVVIVGVKSVDQLVDNAAAMGWSLTYDEWQRLESLGRLHAGGEV
jgi:aryl-alcohol dehydrogenase-like predicted oxidoreductase